MMTLKILAVVFLFIGETLSIYTEMLAAQHINNGGVINFPSFTKYFLLIALAGGFLIFGYMYGIKSFSNIWIVAVASIAPILIVEPLLGWMFFHHIPTKGAVIGLVFAFLALISATFIN